MFGPAPEVLHRSQGITIKVHPVSRQEQFQVPCSCGSKTSFFTKREQARAVHARHVARQAAKQAATQVA